MKKQTITGAPLMATITNEGSVFIHENKRNAKRYLIGVTRDSATIDADDINAEMVVFYKGLPLTPNSAMLEGATIGQILDDFNATAQRLDELFSAQSADAVAVAVRDAAYADNVKVQPLREWVAQRFNGGSVTDLINDNLGVERVLAQITGVLYKDYYRATTRPVFIANTACGQIIASDSARGFRAQLSAYWHRYDNNAQLLDAVEDFGGFGGFYVATINRNNVIIIYAVPLNCAL